MELESKVAVITGGTKGIGYAVADRLLRAGVRVFICGRDRTDLRGALESLAQHGEVAGEICGLRCHGRLSLTPHFAACKKTSNKKGNL